MAGPSIQLLTDPLSEYLERCNIAWPNPMMYATPWTAGATDLPNLLPALIPSSNVSDSHIDPFRLDSGYHSPPYTMPPPPAPTMAGVPSLRHPFSDMHSLSSRSTSSTSGSTAYSAYVGARDSKKNVSIVTNHPSQAVQFRLPSDQLQQIIDALSGPNRPSVINTDKSGQQAPTVQQLYLDPALISPELACSSQAHDSTAALPTEHTRIVSDVSMHPLCNDFPGCTLDNPAGHGTIHSCSAKSHIKSPKLEIRSSILADMPDIDADLDALVDGSGSGDSCVLHGSSRMDSPKKRSISALGGLEQNSCNGSQKRKLSKTRSGTFEAATKEMNTVVW